MNGDILPGAAATRIAVAEVRTQRRNRASCILDVGGNERLVPDVRESDRQRAKDGQSGAAELQDFATSI